MYFPCPLHKISALNCVSALFARLFFMLACARSYINREAVAGGAFVVAADGPAVVLTAAARLES